MKQVWRFLRSVGFLITLCVSLAISTVTFAMQTANLTTQVADLTLEVATISGQAAAAAIQHRKTIAKAVVRTKAKARLRRVMVAIPIIGIGLAAEFERRDYTQWQGENPDGTMQQYSCEVATYSAEVVDEVLQELPETVRPSRATVLNWMPECEAVQ